jgi:DNA-binding NarL/FixJ family response regulator
MEHLPFGASPARPRDLVAAHGEMDGHEVLVLSYAHRPAMDLGALSAAERDVVDAVLGGAKNAEIAHARGTSVLTVAKQVASALRKLGARSRGELAAMATGSHPHP